MQKDQSCILSATKILESLDVGGRVESDKAYSYLNTQRTIFQKLNPDRRIVLSKSKFKEGVTIIMRAE
ncbi:hypothetical protein [Sphingobacterium lactis]|uniref:Uncharacterized protein n=1 Tax=Sphingobacterium lactis TaxID=797291 RepID=A0A1H6CSG7_9SPHI|nr:hypothetical protein [Sphingobacterium lactis]SEG75356.1 hypothetical protein SAMN05421877_1193 [Sphingobacterium lactis]